jgi:Lysyl oxidase
VKTAALLVAGTLGAVAVAVLVGLGGRGQDDSSPQLLPDLVVRAPYGLEITHAGGRARLGFESAASNFGAGPLVVQGHRRPGASTMAAVQEIALADGGAAEVEGVGRLRYVVSSDHDHWHFLPFMRYELRPTGRPGAVLRDRKTGFCLGDRFDAETALPNKPDSARFISRCGRGSRGRLGVRQGISVGYGDDYKATLEGQFVDVTGLPAGLYVLVHRVNEGRRLQESSYDNNASSTLVRLERVAGNLVVSSLRRCSGRETCGPAPG